MDWRDTWWGQRLLLALLAGPFLLYWWLWHSTSGEADA